MASMTDEEFEAGRAFVLAFAELNPHGSTAMRAMVELSMDKSKPEYANSAQKRGLISAIGGFLEATNSWYPDHIEELDAALKTRGVPTLCDIRLTYSRKIHQTLGRKRIRSLEEFNYLASMLVSGLLTPEQQVNAKTLLAEAEGKPASGMIVGRHLLKG